MRIPIALGFLALLATFAPAGLHVPPQVPAQSFVRFAPLEMGKAGQVSSSKLRLLAGWEIESNDPRFGGLSGMHMDEKGVLAVSDGGFAYRFRLLPEGALFPLAVTQVRDGPGSWSKRSRDLEAINVSKGQTWLSLESSRAIWRYDRASGKGEAGTKPPAMRLWPRNGGAEAMVRLADGRFLVFSERHFLHGSASEALSFHGDPAEEGTAETSFIYQGPAGYRVTDVAALSDGRLLFLHRKASIIHGFSAKISVAALPETREGLVLRGEEVASIALLDNVNFEALSIKRENGRDTVWVASDDNFSPLLRTVLLKFQFAG